jgi:hypothetical protein
MRKKVFVSYSHKDKKWLAELQTMLKPLVHDGSLDIWDDTRIKPGENWKAEIEKALASAKVAVLLVSANFLASDFIQTNELPPLLRAAKDEGMVIYWIYISSCMYDKTEIKDFQAAHDIAHPLDCLIKARRQVVLKSICTRIGRALPRKKTKKKPKASVSNPARQPH